MNSPQDVVLTRAQTVVAIIIVFLMMLGVLKVLDIIVWMWSHLPHITIIVQ